MRKILHFHYFGGGGAKLIANCLTFSQKVAIAHYDLALSQKENPNSALLEKYHLGTVPNKENARKWFDYEHGCSKLFGPGIDLLKHTTEDNVKIKDMEPLKEYWLPLNTHTIFAAQRCQAYFSQDQIFRVLLDATPEFIDLAIRKKWPEEHHCLDLDAYKVFRDTLKDMKFDMEILNWNPLISENLHQINRLADRINCSFDLTLAANYIQKYVNFHLD